MDGYLHLNNPWMNTYPPSAVMHEQINKVWLNGQNALFFNTCWVILAIIYSYQFRFDNSTVYYNLICIDICRKYVQALFFVNSNGRYLSPHTDSLYSRYFRSQTQGNIMDKENTEGVIGSIQCKSKINLSTTSVWYNSRYLLQLSRKLMTL